MAISTMHRVDTEHWTVVEVECPNGSDYPARDSSGHTIYFNTHFQSRREALERLRQEAESAVRLVAARVEYLRQLLAEAERDATDAAVGLAKAISQT